MIGITDSKYYDEIGSALQRKLETDKKFTPAEMGRAILSIEGEGGGTLEPEDVTITPSKTQQIIRPSATKYLNKVTVEPIPARFVDTSDATATRADILAGKTAYVDGVKVTGTYQVTQVKPTINVLSGVVNGDGSVTVTWDYVNNSFGCSMGGYWVNGSGYTGMSPADCNRKTITIPAIRFPDYGTYTVTIRVAFYGDSNRVDGYWNYANVDVVVSNGEPSINPPILTGSVNRTNATLELVWSNVGADSYDVVIGTTTVRSGITTNNVAIDEDDFFTRLEQQPINTVYVVAKKGNYSVSSNTLTVKKIGEVPICYIGDNTIELKSSLYNNYEANFTVVQVTPTGSTTTYTLTQDSTTITYDPRYDYIITGFYTTDDPLTFNSAQGVWDIIGTVTGAGEQYEGIQPLTILDKNSAKIEQIGGANVLTAYLHGRGADSIFNVVCNIKSVSLFSKSDYIIGVVEPNVWGERVPLIFAGAVISFNTTKSTVTEAIEEYNTLVGASGAMLSFKYNLAR